MTREEVITLAHKVNINVHTGKSFAEDLYIERLACFAAAVAAHEREACAKLCRTYAQTAFNNSSNNAAMELHDAIKARGEE